MASKRDRKRLQFTHSIPIRPKNLIISSTAVSNNNIGFIPSYEKDGTKANMHCILQMEYKRIWFKELKTYEKITYSSKNSCLLDAQISRKYVLRTLKINENPLELAPIKIKKFQNVKARTDNHNFNPPKREGLDKKIELPGFNVPIVIKEPINKTQIPNKPDSKAALNEQKKSQDKKKDGQKVDECGIQNVCPQPCQQMPYCSNMRNMFDSTCCK